MAKWIWPCPGNTTITSGVGPRWGKSHNGIDISAPQGSKIIASREGKVTAVNNNCNHNYAKPYSEYAKDTCGGGYGNYVYLQHEDGYTTVYAHMTRTTSLKVGDTVIQGQQIGTVGSTGKSTGFHLHFEIKDAKNNYLDPEEHVNASNTIVESEESTGTVLATNTDTTSYKGGQVPYNTKTATAIVSGQFTKNDPLHAYLDIFIGDKRLSYEHGKPSIIMNFTMDRLDDAGNTSQFSIFDDNWEEIEAYLASNTDHIYLQYGYTSGIKSARYKMLLSNYSIEFRDTGTILHVSAISEGIYENLDQGISLDTGTKNPTDAIIAICNAMGWKVDPENFTATNTVTTRDQNYVLNNVNPITYIQTEIIPEAINQEGETVTFYLDAVEEKTAHLILRTYGDTATGSSTSNIRTYVYQKGVDSVVQDMTFDVKGIFGGTSNLSVATGLKSSSFGIYDKQEYTYLSDQNTVATTSTGSYSHTKNSQSTPLVNSGGQSTIQMRNRLYYYVKNSTTSQYQATMTIIGDPSINLLEDVRIINMTDKGFLHHTSGIYMVMGISDTVENGEFLTTLKLQRNGDINDGLELRTPKVVVK